MDAFELLKKKIKDDRGFNCENYKETSLRRRLGLRMRATHTESYGAYLEYLKTNESEYGPLMKALTVNFTEFFRDPGMYDFLRDDILPDIVRRKREQGRKIIRVWSAGCSSGEEPYSVAILVKEFLGSDIDYFIVNIRASDIDDVCLSAAKAGDYEELVFKNIAPSLFAKYFERAGEKYRVKDEIKALVKFEKHDLISGERKKYFDVILCRNVFIYFSRDTQKDLFEMFYEALNSDGYLIIGKTETMHEGMSKKFEMVSLCERIFRKVG
jgi:chemotaxis protein methyltransferase CheR